MGVEVPVTHQKRSIEVLDDCVGETVSQVTTL